MPKGKTHRRVNTFIGLPFALIVMINQMQLPTSLIVCFSLAYLYGTYFWSPDLDMAHYSKPLSLKGLFVFPFIPYAWFSKHRGLSHSIVWGTLSRMAYVLILSALLFLAINKVLGPTNLTLPDKETSLCIFLAFFYADLIHILLDRLFIKRW